MLEDAEHLMAQNSDLKEELRLSLLANEKLRAKCAALASEVHISTCSLRIRRSMRRAESLSSAVIVKFPPGVFTLAQLEAANPAFFREDIRMRLAYRVSLKHVEFLPSSQRNEGAESTLLRKTPLPLVYRVAAAQRAMLCVGADGS